MAIITVYGMTESGKSFHVKNEYLKKVDRCIIFDFAKCFDGGEIIKIENAQDMIKVFRKYAKRKKYKLILRPNRGANVKFLCDLLVSLSCALGRALSKTYNPKKRVWLVIDEADMIVSPHYQSKMIKHLVNYGRHDNVDSIFIARNPNRLHTDIRANASKIVSFKLQNATQIQDFTQNFTRENARKIRELEKYHRFEWNDTGLIKIYDDKGAVTWSE